MLYSLPGFGFMLAGVGSVISDGLVGGFLVLFGAMMTPLFWRWAQNKLQKSISWKLKVLSFVVVLFCIGVVVPETSPQVLPSENENQQSETLPETSESVLNEGAEEQKDATNEIVSEDSLSQRSQDELVSTPPDSSNGVISATVTRVVDGDTFSVTIDGKAETVRVIGIDTPETVQPNTPVECFGIEASNKAKSLLQNQTVELTFDDSQGERDKYDRLLVYAILSDGSDFGEVMIRGGFAREYTYASAYGNQTRYKAAQDEATNAKVGLWAEDACTSGVVTEQSKDEVMPPTVSNVTTKECSIKGNISSSGEKIYHTPGQQHYTDTVIDAGKGERWFCSENEAIDAGWRKALR